MPILDSIFSSIGSAVRAYQTAINPANPRLRRPMFLNSVADSEKWKGGDLGHKDAAYKRALQNSWIYTAIHFKANELAAGRLYVSHNETGMQDDSVPVKNHPLARILRKPNPLMGRGFLWQYSQWWLDLSGNAYWFLAPDEDNNLAEIYPLPANAVNPFPGDRERLTDYYEYTVNGRKWDIPAEYICHFRYPNPYDYFRGLSPLVAALLPSDADSAMAHWNGAFFGSGNVMPSAIINVSSGVPGTADSIDPQDMEAIKDALTSGDYAASARRTVVTNAYEMAVNILGWNAKDMDFLQGRMFTKDEILNIMGIPPGLLDKNATEANATTGDNVFKEKTLWPLMSTIYAETITSQILERWYSVGEEAAFEDIRPINKMQLLQEAQASTADMTRKERRARFWNLPPLGDERDDEIPGAGQAAAPADPSGMGTPGAGAGMAGGFPLPNMRNAAPEAVRALSPDALSDLRRWKNVMLKSYRENTEPKLDFVSDHIPFDVRTQVLNGLVHAETPEHVKSIFSEWMPGEASTKASPFPLTGTGLSTHKDDPFLHVKRMTESELEQALREYFAGLAVRVGEQVGEGRKHLPGKHDQEDHAGGDGTTEENTVGFSFFRGTLTKVSDARKIGLSSDGWEKHEKIFKDKYLKRFDLEDEVERTIGLWDGPEPSFNAYVKGSRENIIAMAKQWGKDYNQEGMVVLLPSPGADGGKLIWDIDNAASDADLDILLGSLNEVKNKYKERTGKNFPLGVTVKNGETSFEYWHGDEDSAKEANDLITSALNKTTLKTKFRPEGGYEFIPLSLGEDY